MWSRITEALEWCGSIRGWRKKRGSDSFFAIAMWVRAWRLCYCRPDASEKNTETVGDSENGRRPGRPRVVRVLASSSDEDDDEANDHQANTVLCYTHPITGPLSGTTRVSRYQKGKTSLISRKGIQPVKNWVVGCWHGYLSGARYRLAYGPADATATHCVLLQ